MAKMFYTLEEAAQKLGKSTADLKAMADGGELQVFRDGEKMMFKCTQIDAEAGGEIPLSSSDSGSISLADHTGTGITIFDSDQIKSAGDSMGGSKAGISFKSDSIHSADSSSPGKINVFSPDEVNDSDSMAATQADANFRVKDEDLALESVGSGSGLLDLTRETDDTSLGAELLDEIYPTNNTESQDIKMDTAAIGSTGIFDSNLRSQTKSSVGSSVGNIGSIGENSGSGFGSLSDTGGTSSPVFSSSESSFQASLSNADTGTSRGIPTAGSAAGMGAPATKSIATPSSLQMVAPVEYVEEEDPMGNLFMSGVMFCALAATLTGLFAIVPALQDMPGKLTKMLVGSSLPVIFGILLFLSIVMGVLGFVVRNKRQSA